MTKQHIEGSRKQKVHELFDTKGPEMAWVLGIKLGLKENSIRSWFSQWKRLDGAPKVKANVKSVTKVEAPKPKKKSKANGKAKVDAKVEAAAA